jgi:hypothetical protein
MNADDAIPKTAKGIVKPEDEPKPTRRAETEAVKIADGTLQRTEQIRRHVHYGGLIAFWTLVVVGTSLTLVWAWHLGAPEQWRFLNTEQLSDLQKTLLAAVGSSTATQLSRKWLGEMDRRDRQED